MTALSKQKQKMERMQRANIENGVFTPTGSEIVKRKECPVGQVEAINKLFLFA